MNATCVAFYGEKAGPLAAVLELVQAQASRLLGSDFSPYRLAQIHATMVGLEEARSRAGEVVNANYLSLRGEARAMDLPRLVEHLRTTPLLPFTVRFGGFDEGAAFPFVSRAEHPFARSVSIQDMRLVVMGWPCSGGAYPTTLARLRRDVEAFGVLHKYHAAPEDVDNDLFMVVGRVRRAEGDDARLRVVVEGLREELARFTRRVVVDVSSLSVVSYVDPALPLETSVALPISGLDKEAFRSRSR